MLRAEGRITNQDLAARVGLSASACLVRVRRLEASGMILGYHARIAVERIAPMVVVFAEVTLIRHHAADFADFEAFVLTVPEIVEASQVSGSFDYLLKVAARDMGAWRDLSDRILGADLGVGKISSHVMMKAAKPFDGYPVPPRSLLA